MHSHSDSKEKLEAELHKKVNQQMQSGSALDQYFLTTLNNFAYRYFTGEAGAQKLSDTSFQVQYAETKMVEALKTSNPEAREGIKQLARSVPVKQQPTVLYQLGIEMKQLSGEADSVYGSLEVYACLNWDFPEHKAKTDKQMSLRQTVRFEDFHFLRNNLPKYLETVCGLF